MITNFENNFSYAQKLDAADDLKDFREQFYIPKHQGKESIYFNGNSLGLQPKSTLQYLQQELDDWARLGVDGHFDAINPWVTYHEILTRQLCNIVGALPHEVVAMNSLTVNLHLLMVSFYRPTKKRYKIICEAKAFPSDQYAFESQVRFHGLDPDDAIIEVKPKRGEHYLHTSDIVDAIKKHSGETALVLFGGINYYTGQLYDMEAITKAAHEEGIIAGFDLAHAIGNVELRLHDWKADFACWCSYKYLNSSPGGISGIYINEKYVKETSLKKLPRFAGWWGYNKTTRFKMARGFDAIPTAESWQLSNSPILILAAHKASLDIFEAAGMDRLHAKRKMLAAYIRFILDKIIADKGSEVTEVITPANENERGCQVSILMHQRGRETFDALTKHGVVADWREPNVIRVAPVPLYNRFMDIWEFGQIVEAVLSK
ncbi:MAG TPA: kynureninase [Panacibacter sp.]|nr:kynureninase [Panacibacter sp.]HNP42681.1 kynureninase [Panacibacter sp.]